MKTLVCVKLVCFLIGYVYLNLISGAASLENLKNDCIFGVKSVTVILYDEKHPYGEELGIKDICNIDNSKKVAFIVHGFTSSPNNTEFYNLTQEILKKNYTVFSLDWAQAACTNGIPLLKLLEYPSAVTNTREVGEFMASYVIKLIKECKVPEKNIQCIGHSLGAHVCGFAGKDISAKLHRKLPRIIGLDPAAPLFRLNQCNQRLCKSDADYVTIFYTSPLGMPYSIGHVNLYFNPKNVLSKPVETKQPGCSTINVSCSHTRSVEYLYYILLYIGYGYPGVPKFHQSLDSKTTDCVFVNGTILERNYIKEGQYIIRTEKKYPYCVKNTFSCNKYNK